MASSPITENSIRNFGEEIGYTQGAGITYNVEFDTFKELFQIIFSGKNKKEKERILHSVLPLCLPWERGIKHRHRIRIFPEIFLAETG